MVSVPENNMIHVRIATDKLNVKGEEIWDLVSECLNLKMICTACEILYTIQ